MFHKGEELVGEAQDAFSEHALLGFCSGVGLPQSKQSFLKAFPSPDSLLTLLALEALSVRVHSEDFRDPTEDLGVLGVRLLERAQVSEEVHPAALMQSQVVVVSAVEVADEDAGERLPQHALGDLMPPACIPQEVPNVRRGEAPQVPVLPILPPARLIRVH